MMRRNYVTLTLGIFNCVKLLFYVTAHIHTHIDIYRVAQNQAI